MSTGKPRSLAARARARFDGSELRARMSPAGVRQAIRLGPDRAARASTWPESSRSLSDFARSVDDATKAAGNNPKEKP